MILPKLETTTYETTLPSTGKSITFRPYLVKEEKALLIAMETGDIKVITKNIMQLIGNCIVGDFDVNDLTLYDFEFVFLQLRSKSLGEEINVTLKCARDGCDTEHDVIIPIEDIKFEYPKGEKTSNVVKLNDKLGVTLKHIPATILQTMSENDITKLSPDAIQRLIRSAIVNIFDDNDVWDVKDVPTKELDEFIESMTAGQLKKIQEYVSNQPSMVYEHEWKCSKCGYENKIVLKGMEAFLE